MQMPKVVGMAFGGVGFVVLARGMGFVEVI